MKIIGIIGKLNTGKDTVAEICQKQGYIRRAFADPVKEIVHSLFRVPREILWGASEERTGEVRQMLQGLGTDYARRFRPNVWVDKMDKQLRTCADNHFYGVVIPDVRFINEAELLHSKGAALIHITRTLSGAHETSGANSHQSETENALIPHQWITHAIVNDGSLQELADKVERVLEAVK